MIIDKNILIAVVLSNTISVAQGVEIAGSEWEILPTVGINSSIGNSESLQINLGLQLKNEREKWRHYALIRGIKSTQNDVRSGERYDVAIKTDYKFDESNYVFGTINYEDDRFSGYDYRATEAIGYGRRIFNSKSLLLDLEGGPGARQSKLTDTGKSDNEAILRLGGLFQWNISDHTNYSQDLTAEVGKDLTLATSTISLRTKIAGNVSTNIQVTLRHLSEAPAGKHRNDMQSSVTVGYCF